MHLNAPDQAVTGDTLESTGNVLLTESGKLISTSAARVVDIGLAAAAVWG